MRSSRAAAPASKRRLNVSAASRLLISAHPLTLVQSRNFVAFSSIAPVFAGALDFIPVCGESDLFIIRPVVRIRIVVASHDEARSRIEIQFFV